MTSGNLLGSAGERHLQQRLGTADRAESFYARQMTEHLNDTMRAFILRQQMFFLSTADANGECDSSLRAGEPGFVRVLDATTLAYPEYRGNGVLASLGNILENPHAGLMFIDFFRDLIGLHVNGAARIVEPATMTDAEAAVLTDARAQHWVVIDVEEAYIHCSKHIPLLERKDRHIHWGTDDARRKGGDYFGVTAARAANRR